LYVATSRIPKRSRSTSRTARLRHVPLTTCGTGCHCNVMELLFTSPRSRCPRRAASTIHWMSCAWASSRVRSCRLVATHKQGVCGCLSAGYGSIRGRRAAVLCSATRGGRKGCRSEFIIVPPQPLRRQARPPGYRLAGM
jgi:hypothetical protein